MLENRVDARLFFETERNQGIPCTHRAWFLCWIDRAYHGWENEKKEKRKDISKAHE